MVKIELASAQNKLGIRLGFDGIATDGKNVFFTEGPEWRTKRSIYPVEKEGEVWLKLRNFRKDISFYYSSDGNQWKKFDDALRSHNSYRISLFAAGKGTVTFKSFKYQGLE